MRRCTFPSQTTYILVNGGHCSTFTFRRRVPFVFEVTSIYPRIMSFFGFETTLPRDREAPAMSPRSFFETSDPFARLSGPSASRATHEAAGDNEEDV